MLDRALYPYTTASKVLPGLTRTESLKFATLLNEGYFKRIFQQRRQHFILPINWQGSSCFPAQVRYEAVSSHTQYTIQSISNPLRSRYPPRQVTVELNTSCSEIDSTIHAGHQYHTRHVHDATIIEANFTWTLPPMCHVSCSGEHRFRYPYPGELVPKRSAERCYHRGSSTRCSCLLERRGDA